MVRPPSTGRIFMTPPSIAISCTSTLPATSALTPTSLSGELPLFSMVRKPPPVLAPPGVARVQACVITRSPALTSSARTEGAARNKAETRAPRTHRLTEVSVKFATFILLFLRLVSFHEMSSRMQRAKQAYDHEDQQA